MIPTAAYHDLAGRLLDDGTDLRVSGCKFADTLPCRRHEGAQEWCGVVWIDGRQDNRSGLRISDSEFRIACPPSEAARMAVFYDRTKACISVDFELNGENCQGRDIPALRRSRRVDQVVFWRAPKPGIEAMAVLQGLDKELVDSEQSSRNYVIDRSGTVFFTSSAPLPTDETTKSGTVFVGVVASDLNSTVTGDMAIGFDVVGENQLPAYTYAQYHALQWLLNTIPLRPESVIAGLDELPRSEGRLGPGEKFRWEYVREPSTRQKGQRLTIVKSPL